MNFKAAGGSLPQRSQVRDGSIATGCLQPSRTPGPQWPERRPNSNDLSSGACFVPFSVTEEQAYAKSSAPCDLADPMSNRARPLRCNTVVVNFTRLQ